MASFNSLGDRQSSKKSRMGSQKNKGKKYRAKKKKYWGRTEMRSAARVVGNSEGGLRTPNEPSLSSEVCSASGRKLTVSGRTRRD